MLVELSITDFVLIERATLELGSGLTVVTGATGEGKTLFLRALRFVLGERATAERLIRPTAERAVVEALFRIDDEALRADLRERGLPDDWEGPDLVLSRSVDAAGRTRVRIGGRLASVAELKRVGERLVDVLSQHEYQSLSRPERQRVLLDSLGRLGPLAARFAADRTHLRALAERRDAVAADQATAREREESRRDALEALRALAPREGELEALERERLLLANVESVRVAIEQARERLVGGEGAARDGAALDLVRASVRELEAQSERAPALGKVAQTLSVLASELSSAGMDLVRERDRLDADPARLSEVEERIDAYRDLARRLARKGLGVGTAGAARATVARPTAARPTAARPTASVAVGSASGSALVQLWDELERLESDPTQAVSVEDLDREIVERARALEALAAELRRGRTDAARELECRVHATLADLALKDARIAVVVDPLECLASTELASCLDAARDPGESDAPVAPSSALDLVASAFPNPAGLDRVEITFASAPGARPGPLGSVASGGELARTCLALKRALAEVDDVPLLVFDEVDQNVGGRLGSAIGRTLRSVSTARQVLAITHLPSVAAFADDHHLVEKHVAASSDAPPCTTVRPLDVDQRIREMALMLGGEPVGQAALEQAREMFAAARSARPPAPNTAAPARRRKRERARSSHV